MYGQETAPVTGGPLGTEHDPSIKKGESNENANEAKASTQESYPHESYDMDQAQPRKDKPAVDTKRKSKDNTEPFLQRMKEGIQKEAEDPDDSSGSDEDCEFNGQIVHLENNITESTAAELQKGAWRKFKYKLKMEGRIGALEERMKSIESGEDGGRVSNRASSQQASGHKSPGANAKPGTTSNYQTKFYWTDDENDATDNPDPGLTWDELVAFYATGLERKVAEVEWDDFCRESQGPTCVIEVPLTDWRDWQQDRLNDQHKVRLPNGKKRAGDDQQRHVQAALTSQKQAIRINSNAVLHELRQITQEAIPKGIITAPFKEFWFLRSAIQSTLEKLRERVHSAECEASKLPFSETTPDSSAHSDAMQIFSTSKTFARLKAGAKAAATLPDFEYVMDCMDSQLKRARDALEDLNKSERVPEVHFRDLWKFFPPGQLILNRIDGHDQALRVLHATGGQAILGSEHATSKSSGDHDLSDSDDPTSAYNGGDSSRNYTDLRLDCYYVTHDGKRYGPVRERLVIETYSGKKQINTLSVYPIDYCTSNHQGTAYGQRDARSICHKLTSRGKRFCSFVADSMKANPIPHMNYTGLTLDGSPEEIECPVVIDVPRASEMTQEVALDPGIDSTKFSTRDKNEQMYFWTIEKTCAVPGCQSRRCQKEKKKYLGGEDSEVCLAQACAKHQGHTDHLAQLSHDNLTEEDMMMLPYKVFGYVLRRRRWAALDIDCIHDLEEEPNPFKQLVIEKTHRDLVTQLVRSHLEEKRNASEEDKSLARNLDPIKGKGGGLVILLHGEPGVGKTSTAEAVATSSQLPLYPITCGDLGNTPQAVEDRLHEIFRDAHRWNCILLLDEADIFLTRRSQTEMERNALVSVFLRNLEYYQGILFLTTHRVGVLDDAFKSRIRLSLYYGPLDLERTLAIFNKNIKRIREKDPEAKVEKEKILGFAQKHFTQHAKMREDGLGVLEGWWNGRQIRNAFQTAIALATFNKVAKTMHHFEGYMKETRGGLSEIQYAQELWERSVYYALGAQAKPLIPQAYPPYGAAPGQMPLRQPMHPYGGYGLKPSSGDNEADPSTVDGYPWQAPSMHDGQHLNQHQPPRSPGRNGASNPKYLTSHNPGVNAATQRIHVEPRSPGLNETSQPAADAAIHQAKQALANMSQQDRENFLQKYLRGQQSD